MTWNHTLLTDRVAVVTGASRGIGAVTARVLAAAGACVVLAARDKDALDARVVEITAAGGRAHAARTGVSDPASVEGLVAQTLDRFGRLDIAVNNAAGGGHPPTPLAEVDVDDYDSALTISLRGVFLAMKYEIPALLRAGGGSIVNMGSAAGLNPVAGLAGYVSAKAGLAGLTRSAALDYADKGIRINALAPGPIATGKVPRDNGSVARRIGDSLPIRRVGTPDEVADAVVWLCSPAASFVTGAVIPVDGGMLAGMAPFREPSA